MNTLNQLPKWVQSNKLWRVDFDECDSAQLDRPAPSRWEATPQDANAVSSIKYQNDNVTIHCPLIDLDFEAELIPSSTTGHYHLYINKFLSHDDYLKLITVLAEVGIVSYGILHQLNRDGATFLRLPNVKKELTNGHGS